MLRTQVLRNLNPLERYEGHSLAAWSMCAAWTVSCGCCVRGGGGKTRPELSAKGAVFRTRKPASPCGAAAAGGLEDGRNIALLVNTRTQDHIQNVGAARVDARMTETKRGAVPAAHGVGWGGGVHRAVDFLSDRRVRLDRPLRGVPGERAVARSSDKCSASGGRSEGHLSWGW